MKWLFTIIINAVLFLALDGYFDSFSVSSFGAAIGASFILSILNVLVRPILIILTLPVTIVTLGLFLFVINATTLMLTEWIMGDAFDISSFGMALLASILISIANLLFQKVIFDKE
ncbi:phage holin family protein [Bacillus spongiae]|uniref:Phage holin family protein n=1 Tax=Bacillus spongiae TaxID=2683610 RepID=A0ABU8HF31_9BACI